MEEIQIVKSTLLENHSVKHGWLTRHGGKSKENYMSLNIGGKVGDDITTVAKNMTLGISKGGGYIDKACFMTHEHKDTVHHYEGEGSLCIKCDGAWTKTIGTTLAQGTADCGTIILALPNKVVGLVHSSWRTLTTKLIGTTVEKMTQFHYKPDQIIASLGPSVCKKCYEFGEEAEELFEARYIEKKDDRHYVDLKQMMIDQLRSSGVSHVEDMNICTYEDERFYSHRRTSKQQNQTGRFLTIVSL